MDVFFCQVDLLRLVGCTLGSWLIEVCDASYQLASG